MAILRDVATFKDLMITDKNTPPRKAFHSAPKTAEQGASLEKASCSDSKEEQAVLSGVKPVLELLEREPERIDAVLVRKGKRSQDTDRILDLCRTAKVRFTLADAQSLDRLCPAGHQGVVARLFEAGFTEFAEKYDELVWYFLLAGYSVCVLEHRGHGKSARNRGAQDW